MNIQERTNKDGKITSYRIRVFDHRDSEGKQVFKTLSVKYDATKSAAWNKKNAEKQGAVFEKQVEEQTASDARVTFAEYAEYFLKIKEQSGLAPSTIGNYKVYKRKITPYIGHIQLKSLNPTALNKAYSKMLSDGVTKTYAHELHVFIHNVLEMALREGIIYRNYAEAATPPKADKKEVTAIDEIVLKRFFDLLYANEDEYMKKVFFSVLLAAGCRIGELCALTWNNVDFEEGRIHICRHWISTEKGWVISDGCKTAAGKRWIYMDEGIMDMLREYREYYLKTAKEYGSKFDLFANAVFFSERNDRIGNCITPAAMRSWLTKFLKNNNMPHIRPHQFRHTAISLQLKAGISVPEAAKRAGHCRSDVTLRIYSHVLNENDKHCCEAVTKVLPKLPKPAAG